MVNPPLDFDALLHLRIIVLALGESTHAGWWKSQFLSPVGQRFLNQLYPRSEFAAAVRSAIRAAKPVHDSSIGLGGVFHLFRLPQDVERHLSQTLLAKDSNLQTEITPWLAQQDNLLDALNRLGQPPLKRVLNGPQRMGSPRDIRSGTWIESVAAAYCAAFRAGSRVYFPKQQFDDAFYESPNRSARDKSIFSLKRAERIEWIGSSLQDKTAEIFAGWDREKKRIDQKRRVTLIYGNYVVALQVNLKKSSATFITAYVADAGTLAKIRLQPRWS